MRAAFLAVLLSLAACAGPDAAAPPPSTSSTSTPPSSTTTSTAAAPSTTQAGAAESSLGGVVVAPTTGLPYSSPDGSTIGVADAGLPFPVLARENGRMLVLTTCEEEAWVESVDAEPIARGAGGTPGEMAFSDAVIVIDPGHGGPNRGAVGPTGLVEADINVDIAGRVAALLESSQLLDGSDVPPAGRVILTRVPTSQGTDYEAGLAYRAELANRAGAHALVSIHNNADPDGPSDETGAEAWHRVMDHESRRLAGLMVEELRRAFAGFEADWAADTDAGAKARARDDGVTDYYGVLRNAGVPAVIVEGAYLSNPSEEALLREPAFRDAYASAVHAALVRFITTTDPGSGFTEAYPRTVPAGSGDPRPGCRVPEFSG